MMPIKKTYSYYPSEILKTIIQPLIVEGKEAVSSTGDSLPVTAFSRYYYFFTDYFKQRIPQVTANPIDHLREGILLDMTTNLRYIASAFPVITTPVLTRSAFSHFEKITDKDSAALLTKRYLCAFNHSLRDDLLSLVAVILADVRDRHTRIIILDEADDISRAIPMIMLVGCLANQLMQHNVYDKVCIICATREVFDAHSAACLIGFGATLIYPYGLYELIEQRFTGPDFEPAKIENNAIKSLNSGLLKIIAKSAMTSLSDYRNSRFFDLLGPDDEIFADCFTGAIQVLAYVGYRDVELALSTREAFISDEFFSRDQNYPRKVIQAIHRLSKSAALSDYNDFSQGISGNSKLYLRDFFTFINGAHALPLEEVESQAAILSRFSSAAMSLGAISPEAHQCLAIAMNELGCKSNSGEGGEDKRRYYRNDNSKIKQVAAGRFGVTPEYLVSAQELQIKISQGAKPGEGAQLPGVKVTDIIAQLRCTRTGVTLISPPSHHDIATHQDLKDFIANLRCINPGALISVKIASTSGIGKIALAIVQAGADKIVLSGGDGGTGAAPSGSIRFAGLPFEFILAEVHRELVLAGVRNKTILEVDGGLKNGADVVKAAMIGADAFSFGTMALIAMGCKMCRTCNKNSCSVGIATQNEKFRLNFSGTPEGVKNYFLALAQDVRKILSQLGHHAISDVIGKTELLIPADKKIAHLFVSCHMPAVAGPQTTEPVLIDFSTEIQTHPEVFRAIAGEITSANVVLSVDEVNSGFITFLCGCIARRYGDRGLTNSSITFNISMANNKYLASFLLPGLTVMNRGGLGHYVGVGMSGGNIIVSAQEPQPGSARETEGNSCLYGATGGMLFTNCPVGNRFAVRNSGADAVVENVGDHACEYMTGGNVVILGGTGVNFGAGMTGGVAFVYDKTSVFLEKINPDFVTAFRLTGGNDYTEKLQLLIAAYAQHISSALAASILADFDAHRADFWVVVPHLRH
ncbi:glutamate synthase-related protein [Brenneria goodwinii]|uniref:glutamate synthase-related protein n=1 Tax=Brenneria goodwinii TaxID=1109412 RepID=UPI0036EC5B92